jgi:gamma-glutamyl:cysteine ligase YbdK (ATP-grasp superfamily)
VPLHLFEAFGVELEYMLVDRVILDVAPVADRIIRACAGDFVSDVEADHGISWSNELVSHVIELKTTEPTTQLAAVADSFRHNVGAINTIGAAFPDRPVQLLPGAMHPWMDPATQTTLWPHEYHDVYANFHRLFNCYRHGWANLQSVHLNLPFSGDDEFARLHAAVRLILPLLPAICASSPVMDGKLTGTACNRLEVYRANQAAVPSLSGRVIPEPAFTEADYKRIIMEPIARDVARLDGSGLMKPDWMNSRGAIARFDRGSIEIRVMDVQECPAADLAIVQGVIGVLRWLVAEGPCSLADQQNWQIDPLVRVLDATIRDADRATIDDAAYLRALGHSAGGSCRADRLWTHLFDAARVPFRTDPALAPLDTILTRGTLSRRLTEALHARGHTGRIPHASLAAVYGNLCECLSEGMMYGQDQG